MTQLTKEQPAVAFSPGLKTGDSLANYWLRQVMLRLRREVCWVWYDRESHPKSYAVSSSSVGDQTSANLDLVRFQDVKDHFFRTNTTAQYLTEQLNIDPFQLKEDCIRGSFSWICRELELNHTSSFLLAMGLLATFDNAAGSVIATCSNDLTKTMPTLALAQKLWDRPEEIIKMTDPTHPLTRYGLIQFGNRSDHRVVNLDWETPFAVPSLSANLMMFPSDVLPGFLTLIDLSTDDDLVKPMNIELVVSGLNSEHQPTLNIVPILGDKGAPYIEAVNVLAKRADRRVVTYSGNITLLENNRFLNGSYFIGERVVQPFHLIFAGWFSERNHAFIQ